MTITPTTDLAEGTEPYTVPLAPGVRAFVQPDGGWCLNNAGILTGGGRTALIDTAATERRARLLRDAALAEGAAPPTTVVNTHHHGDHTYGNFVFPEATVVGHAACRTETLAAGLQLHAIWPGVEYGDVTVAPPTVTYTEEMALHLGDTEVRLIHPGPAHTVGDTIAWLPEQGVVFTGDLVFNGGTPFLLMGSLSGSLRSLEILRGLDAQTVVPGHGRVTDPGVYDTLERYFRWVEELARDGRAAGRTPLEVARATDLGEFAELREGERLVANIHRAYAELDGLPLGSPLDLPTVLGDMQTMNGGRPMACHA